MHLIRLFGFVLLGWLALFGATANAAPGCPRPVSGADVSAPRDLYSKNGILYVTLNYYSQLDEYNRSLFCFVTDDGVESPTLHLNPGDLLRITLKNMLPTGSAELGVAPDVWGCGSATMTSDSVNMHFHGINVRPICHSDGVVHTLVNPGETFVYQMNIPSDEPPGLYWYHPHVHGNSDLALEGGATGAIIVEGIEQMQPKVAGLAARTLVIRDQRLRVPGMAFTPGASRPSWDLSLNYVPVIYPQYVAGRMQVNPGQKEFWRVVNTSADTIGDLDLNYDGTWQTMEIVALDGVPVGSHDGTTRGTTYSVNHILLPPAGRAEFIVTMPARSVKSAVFETAEIDDGPAGDNNLARPLANLVPFPPPSTAYGAAPKVATQALPSLPTAIGPRPLQRFDGLNKLPVTATRRLYFSEENILGKAAAPASEFPLNFYITVEGYKPKLYSGANPPAVVTTQGAVETWRIENRTQEVHEFHMHQIHYELLAINDQPVTAEQQQFYDTYQVPYWTGTGAFPSITVKMDFRGDIVGDFVYHCHILGHEDGGMMAIIRVLAKPS